MKQFPLIMIADEIIRNCIHSPLFEMKLIFIFKKENNITFQACLSLSNILTLGALLFFGQFYD